MNTNTNSVADVIALAERLANKVALTTTTETPQKIDGFFQETSESKNKTNTNNNKMKVYTNVFHTREQMNADYSHFARSRQPTDICWTWREREQGIGIMNYQEIAHQVAEWNQSGDCSIQDYNNKEVKTPDGKTWYVLVLQVLKATGEMDEEANPMGSMSLLLFGIMCSGYTYVFETAEMRDAVAKAIQTKTPLPKRTTLPRGPNPAFHPICCLCGGFCDCPYGNSVSPLNYDEGTSGVCCNKCLHSDVIPARLIMGLDAERQTKTFAKKAGITITKEETPEEKAERLQAEVEVLTMKAVKKPKELSPKELRKQEEKQQLAEANAYLKAEKKRKEDYAKACGTFRTPEQIKKERDARFKVQCEAMKGSGSKRK